MQFTVVDQKKWEQLPAPTPRSKEDKYTAVLDALEAGEILQIPTADAKEAKGLRISIARKASGRGFKVEYRTEDNTLFVKKSGESVASASKAGKKKEKIEQPA